MRRITYSFAIVAVLLPALASAQTSGSASSTSTAETAGRSAVDAAAEARINVAIERAADAGIPTTLLENKVAEGRAKGVSMTRIAAAVENRAEVLTRVQNILARGEATTGAVASSELVAAADAHEGGVSLENIASLSVRAGNDRAVALSVLADLVASGRTPDHALLRVRNALQAGGNALIQLGSETSAAARTVIPSVRAGANGSAAAETSRGNGTVRAATNGIIRIGG
jgi:hypothetical protein